MKKRVVFVSSLIILSLIAFASADKLDVTSTKDTFIAGESITIKASLLDSNNNPIDMDVSIAVEDAGRTTMIERTISANQVVEVSLGEDAPAGYWKVTAKYQNLEATSLFIIETSELVKFELNNNVLSVINIGNSRYTKTIQIVIGETIGSKEIDLGIGEKTSFRLIAPEGAYNIRITDGKTTFVKPGVTLTGKVIGVLDNRDVSSSPLTSGVKGDEAPYGEEPSAGKGKAFVFIFLAVLVIAAVLLFIERKYRKSATTLTNYNLSN